MVLRRTLAACGLLLICGIASAQERFSIFVGSRPESVARMIQIADLREGDVVADLGSGDGRIVIAAAESNPGVRGWGVDIDEKLVHESNATARLRGLSDRVEFFQRNVFDADLSRTNVIFMWLWPELMQMLRPKILAEAQPGTRVVTNIWELGSWSPDYVDEQQLAINLWVVPARVAGYWEWDLNIGDRTRRYSSVLEQHFQKIEGFVRVGTRRGLLNKMRLRGEYISFALDMTLEGSGSIRHVFNGEVDGDQINGTVRIVPLKDEKEVGDAQTLPWRAVRGTRSAYFEPTGLTRH